MFSIISNTMNAFILGLSTTNSSTDICHVDYKSLRLLLK